MRVVRWSPSPSVSTTGKSASREWCDRDEKDTPSHASRIWPERDNTCLQIRISEGGCVTQGHREKGLVCSVFIFVFCLEHAIYDNTISSSVSY